MKKEVLKKEVRFSWHLPKNDDRDDLHFVREDITYTDGTTEPKTYFVKDFKRPVFVTKKSFQNHKEKKEYEDREKLNCVYTTQSDLDKATAGLLGEPYLVNKPDLIKNSPYVYAYDITSTSFIKYQSLKRNGFIQSAYSVAGLDIETNPMTDQILMVSLVYKRKVRVSILKSFVKNIADPDNRVLAAVGKYLPDYPDLDISLSYHDDEIDMLKDIFKAANDWKPAFLAIWNMDFDISKIMATLKRRGVNPIDVICDQSIPRKLRMCRYRQGSKKKVTASGVVKPVNPSLQWHTLICTSAFYVIDPMCVYRQLRIAKQEEPSYSLDAILQKELKKRKLTFKEADSYKREKWHIFMQENYPIEYIVYNIYDSLGMVELDEKTKDLTSCLPAYSDITDFMKYSSQVRKVSDAVFLFALTKNKILGTAPKIESPNQEDVSAINDELLASEDGEEEVEEDENDPSKYKTLDLKGWIQLLPQNLLLNEGLQCLEEYPLVTTNARGLTSDLDASSSYPSCTLVGNVSKETCVNELIRIDGVTEEVFREQNLSICLGDVNMLEYFEVMFDMPAIDEIDSVIDQYL